MKLFVNSQMVKTEVRDNLKSDAKYIFSKDRFHLFYHRHSANIIFILACPLSSCSMSVTNAVVFPETTVSKLKFLCENVLMKPCLVLTATGCKGAWDSIACWEQAEIGEVVTIPCPRVLKSVFGRNGRLFIFQWKKTYYAHFQVFDFDFGHL